MKFGTPGAKDATAQRERWIEEAAKERVERLNELDRILNRPIGSYVNNSKEQKKETFELMLSQPDQTIAEIQQRASAVGMPRAILEFLQLASEVEDGN